MSRSMLPTAHAGGIPEVHLHGAPSRVMRRLRGVAGPALGAGSAAALTGDAAAVAAAITTGGFIAARMLVRPLQAHANQLPLMRQVWVVIGAVLSLAALVVAGVSFVVPAPVAVAIVLAVTLAGALLVDEPLRRRRSRVRRIVLVGPEPIAAALREELRHSGVSGYELVGRISVGPADPPGHVPTLGALDEMGDVVVEHGIDLLVMGPDIPRLPVFDHVASSCLELPVRLVDLNSFCERVFGHVPLGAINAAWFQYLMHPRFRSTTRPSKRALDLLIAGAAALAFLPILAIAALFIRRDGGPVFFTQTRIGEGGRMFRIYKLRTMRVDDGEARWTRENDPRVTPIGKLLRRTHIDEVPQIINVLRGEMSIVGPRPEQPSYVAQLERDIPFYSRRHLIKPGITGWAQVRCGYAGSIEGSAWKMCHDLYYVKHRSTGLDLLILGETLRTLFADRQFPEQAADLPAFARPRTLRAEKPVLST